MRHPTSRLRDLCKRGRVCLWPGSSMAFPHPHSTLHHARGPCSDTVDHDVKSGPAPPLCHTYSHTHTALSFYDVCNLTEHLEAPRWVICETQETSATSQPHSTCPVSFSLPILHSNQNFPSPAGAEQPGSLRHWRLTYFPADVSGISARHTWSPLEWNYMNTQDPHTD